MRVNSSKKNYNNEFIINDKISESGSPMQFIPESLKVKTADRFSSKNFNLENPVELEEGTDYSVVYNKEYTNIEIKISYPGDKAYQISYNTTAPNDGSFVSNSLSVKGDGVQLKNRTIPTNSEVFTVTRKSLFTDGGYVQIDTSDRIVVYKVDRETRVGLQGAIFQVEKPDGTSFDLPPTNENGKSMSDVIPKDQLEGKEYKLREIVAPAAYKLVNDPISVRFKKIKDDNKDVYVAYYTVPNEKIEKTHIIGSIEWDDNSNQDGIRPNSVQIKIKDDDGNVVETIDVGDFNSWTFDIEVQKNNNDDKPINYTVEQINVNGYTTVVSGSMNDRFVVKNTHVPDVVNVRTTVKWEDERNRDGSRPKNVTLQLYKKVNNVETLIPDKSVTLSKNDMVFGDRELWSKTLINLPKNEAGKEITYVFKTTTVPRGYKVSSKGNDFVFSHTPVIERRTPNNSDRISGSDRIDTAVQVSRKLYPRGSKTVILANKDKFSDVLTAVPLSVQLDAPILFTDMSVLPKETADEISRLGAVKIYINGGFASVQKNIGDYFTKSGKEVNRFNGVDRYETAILIAEKVREQGNKNIVEIASGEDFPDALSLSSLAVKENAPILLSKKIDLTEHTKKALTKWKPSKVTMAGQTDTISKQVQNQIVNGFETLDGKRYNGASKFARLGGDDRFETSAIIAKNALPDADFGVYTSGEIFADALISGPYAARHSSPVLLVKKDSLPNSIVKYSKESKIKKFVVIGGTKTIYDKTYVLIRDVLISK